MGITRQELERALANVEEGLSAFDGSSEQVGQLRRAVAGLQWLREQYRQDAAPFGPYMDRLMDLGRRVDARARSVCEMLTAAYIEAGKAVGAWRERRETCRNVLLELARADGTEGFVSQAGRIEVRRVRTVSLPAADSDARAELTALLTEAGQWPAVGQLNPAKLLKAIDDGAFTPDQADRVKALCPERTALRLTSR